MNKLFYTVAIAAVALPAVAYADTTTTYGGTEVVNSGPGSNPIVFELTSNPSEPYSGLKILFDTPVELSDITQLSADYMMTVGTFGGGAPRFTLRDSQGTAYIYWGTSGSLTDPNAGGWANTGNYADMASADLRVSINGFGGESVNFPFISWADFVGLAGDSLVTTAYLDLDGGFSVPGQQMLADNFTVGGSVFAAVPEPATWAMMIAGFGLVGGAIRSRRVKFSHVTA